MSIDFLKFYFKSNILILIKGVIFILNEDYFNYFKRRVEIIFIWIDFWLML